MGEGEEEEEEGRGELKYLDFFFDRLLIVLIVCMPKQAYELVEEEENVLLVSVFL